MNARAIRALRRKFIFTTMMSFLTVMLFTGSLINAANIFSTRRTMRKMIDYIIENDGDLPYLSYEDTTEEDAPDGHRADDKTLLTPEFHYSTRYFALIYNKDGSIRDFKLSHINAISSEVAEKYGSALRSDPFTRYFTFGNYGDFYYKWGKTSDGLEIVVFLDSTTQVSINNHVISSTVMICGAGMLISFLFVWFFSSRIIRPEIENARRQKQFITNASHELKTPLAVIRANTEIQEMMNGESEWTQSTMRQVDRLDSLIQNLVMITKAEEQEDRSILSEINVSDAVNRSVDPYESLAMQDQKTLTRTIQPDVTMVADVSKIQQLTALLVDNAFKYCDPNGTIVVSLSTQKNGKAIQLTVSNSYAEGASVDYTRFFDRFYRADEARTQDKGGYGIGLSIAESICKSYSGSITASWKDGIISFTCILK